ncbi:hypothetical protein VTO42DRAFT_8206 [Malbranchea cinnamomea]
MSGDGRTPEQTSIKPNQASSSVATGKRSYSDYLRDVDARFKRLTTHLFPDSPYLLNVPTEKPFHLGGRYVSNWAVGKNTVFAPEEEHLQYMTFLSHQNEDTLLVAVGGWADAEGNIMPEEVETVKPAASPQNLGQKKKISLSDYKKKAQQGPISTAAEERKQPSAQDAPRTKAVQQANVSEKEESKPERLKSPLKQNGPTEGSACNHVESRNDSQMRKDDAGKSDMLVKRKSPDQHHSQSPQKKLRVSTDMEQEKEHTTQKEQKRTPMLPKLLSPTLPSLTITPKIPKLLSPTLPPDLEEELAKLPPTDSTISKNRPLTTKKTSANSSSPPTSKKLDARVSENKGQHLGSSSGASSSKDAKAPNSATLSKTAKGKEVKSPVPSQQPPRPASKTVSTVSSTIPNNNKPSISGVKPAARRSRLIVKLKYGRQNRKRVEALLRISGKKRTTADKTVTKQSLTTAAMSPKEPPAPASKSEKQREPSSGSKRPRISGEDDLHEQVAKRPRSSTVTSNDLAQTPAIQANKPHPDSHKKDLLTPQKDLKSAATRRVESADSDTKASVNTSLQNGAGPTSKASKLSSKAKDRDTEWRAWRDEFNRFVAMGRELKHASQRYAGLNKSTTGKPSKDITDEKLGAATAVEAIICFILAFICDDKCKSLSHQLPDSGSWRSIVAYWHVVTNLAAPYPHLHGLCLYLGAISHEAIHSLDLERLATSSVPSEHSLAPTPGSDDNTVTAAFEERRKFSELKSRLPVSYREANRLWLEGSRQLSDEDLARQYPATWSGRSRNFSSRGREKVRPGEYGGVYFLPLGRATTPLEGVRFGLAFLREWCDKEGVEWTGKLVL